ncbi:MAG TPA: hypothetical protein VF841_04875 [Anaeromyxobacter sp.]
MPARSLALPVALALLSGCALRAARPAPLEPPSPGVALAFGIGDGPARCRVELERIPAATFATYVAQLAREERLAGEPREVGLALERGHPALTVTFAPAEAPADPAPAARLCARIREFAAQAEREAADAARRGAPTRWPAGLDPGAVRFRSVQRVTRGGRAVGLAEYAIGARADGARVLFSRGTFLVPSGEGWYAADALQLEEADARGLLVSGRYARFAGGALQYRIDVRRDGDGGFAFSGEASGRVIGGRFEAPGGLATTLARIDLFSERAGGPPAGPVRVETYDPQTDPLRATPVVHRRDPARRRGVVTQVGGRTATGVVAPDGTLEWIEAAGEPPTRTETIWREGTP